MSLSAGATPHFDILGFRWRSDDGDETNATFLSLENAVLDGLRYLGDRIRLRFLVHNTGSTASDVQFRLEYSSSTCPFWFAVPQAGVQTTEHFIADHSQWVPNEFVTSDLAGLSNPGGKTFSSGLLMTGVAESTPLGLEDDRFTELEFVIRSTGMATPGTEYLFRLSDGGDTGAFTYTETPTMRISGEPRPECGGLSLEPSESGSIVTGGSMDGGEGIESDDSTGDVQVGGGMSGGGGVE